MEFPQLYPAPLVSLLLCNLSSHSEATLQMEHLPLASNTGNHSFSTYFCPQSIQRLQWELRTGILLIEPLPGNHLSWGTLILPRWCRWRGCSSSGTRGSILCRVLVITDQESGSKSTVLPDATFEEASISSALLSKTTFFPLFTILMTFSWDNGG